MPIRTSEAEWHGGLRDGQGTMRVGNGVYEGAYSFTSRFAEGAGTNPEELIAAAHAGCFSMALSAMLADAGHPPTRVHTTAKVHIDPVEGGFAITKIHLKTEAQAPGIDAEKFQQIAQDAKKNCPVSKALAAVPEIILDAKLV